ncbi:MAG: NAD(P)-binding protein, partial [Maricaulaceae bacterium]
MTEPGSEAARKSEWDVIVIGSGMGGMSAASALSRLGHKVLLLEQYDALGGLTHSFSRNGFRWDVGIHYLSWLAPGEWMAGVLNRLCDTPIELASLGSVFDFLHIGDAEPLALSRPYEAQIRDLKDRFPGDTDAIDAWFDGVHKAREAVTTVLNSRALPHPFGDALEWWNRDAIKRWCGRTSAEVAASITDNEALKAALLAQWGDHGGRPSVASFATHALISHSYLECGAWYPVGGAQVIAKHMLPVITKAGGQARSGVRVEQLLMD